MTNDAESKKVVITRLDRVIQNDVDARVEHGHDGGGLNACFGARFRPAYGAASSRR